MAKLTKKSVFKTQTPKPETAMDKTTRVVRKMEDEAAEKRQTKIDHLRNARLEKEAHTLTKTAIKK